MKKKQIRVLALLLALALLSGCSLGQPSRSGRTDAFGRTNVKAGTDVELTAFERIAYVRPQLEEMEEAVSQVKDSLDAGEGIRSVTGKLDRCYALYYTFDTMYSLADIRYCQNTSDAYYAAEYAWCGENYSRMQQLMEEMYHACAVSKLAEQLERQYFWDGFVEEYADLSTGALNDEVVDLMRQESALLAQYRALTAAPTIERDGRETDYFNYLEGLLDNEEYTEARLDYYRKYNGPIADIYIAMVRVRQELAAALGYDSYEQMQYGYYFERDYSPEDAAGYVADIKAYMVPLYESVMGRNIYAELRYDYLPEERLHSILGAAAAKIGGQVLQAYDFMSRGGYYDIRLSPLKAAMSFETYLTDYEAPFLFLNPYGDTEDILSYSHEFGHYVDAYANQNAWETVDLSECFSQAMEYLMLSCYEEALSPAEIANLTRIKMLDTLELYVQQASFAEFESAVYAADPEELSAEFLNELSLRLAIEYGYYDGESEEYYAMSWVDIEHFFEYPFYVITYPVANDAAMQIYERERQEEGRGMEAYLAMIPRQRYGLIETLELSGLESPFSPGRIQHVVEDLRQCLA